MSSALFAFGITTLIGSKFGGFMTDRISNPQTLVGGLVVHYLALVLLSTVAKSTLVAIPLLMFWSFSAWSSGPGMQYNLVWLAPEASEIMLSYMAIYTVRHSCCGRNWGYCRKEHIRTSG
ncbi:hypothetical protein [Heyndrickxia acidicola]|uniref:Uncharacterized protein n=1 Tax=Heyndrickxia acidicola TaxID=209389 RepID=A0ABU6MGW0_9BACI|nr:hypothetical protein [Heyndrickxia acidicola]MED1203911.1 hypothetical protein [Heyndrickxia acidicola]